MISSDIEKKDRFEKILEFSVKRLTNQIESSSIENNKKLLQKFMNEIEIS